MKDPVQVRTGPLVKTCAYWLSKHFLDNIIELLFFPYWLIFHFLNDLLTFLEENYEMIINNQIKVKVVRIFFGFRNL